MMMMMILFTNLQLSEADLGDQLAIYPWRPPIQEEN